MDARRIRRFARHLSLPEVGYSGQVAIEHAEVLCFSSSERSRAAFDTAREYLLAAGVGSIVPANPDSPVTDATVAMGDSDQAQSWAQERAIPLVLLVYSENSVRIVSSKPPYTGARRELTLPGPELPSGNIAIGGLVAAEILWQIVGGSHPT